MPPDRLSRRPGQPADDRERPGSTGTSRAPRETEMERYLTTEEVAEAARTSPSTVRYWRHIGKGPSGVKRGRRVLYPQAAVERWLAGQDEPLSA